MDAPSDNEQSLLRNDIHIQATYRLTEALVAAEKRMRRRIELLSEVVFETDREGRLTFLNHAWHSLLGYELDASLGSQLVTFVVEEDRALLCTGPDFADCARKRGRSEIRLRKLDGGIVWMELSIAPLEEGGAVGTLHDITRQKLAQAELAKLSLVASYTDSLVIIADSWGRIEWVNDAFIRKTGYSTEEVTGRKPGELLQGPNSDRATIATISQRLKEGRSFQCEILNYTKSGEEYWVAVHISPIHNAAGKVERFVSIQTDITELRRTQSDLKTAKEVAESASEAKTQFLATISHEMRTPLNVILGSVELARVDNAESSWAGNLKRIDENAETLLGLITDLLDVSKIEAGQFEWEKVDFALRPLMEKSLTPVSERATKKGLLFQTNISPDLPERIMADPSRLRQIVVNLAENAVKFTDSGFVVVDVTQRDKRLCISVTDSGTGISPAALPHVFDRFFQGDSTTTRRKGGAGLGLAIVKSLVDALGGRIRVESVQGRGAWFEVILPLESVAPGRLSSPVSASPTAIPVPLGSVHILVAEDHDSNYAIVERHLTNAGYLVDRASNGRIAVEAAAGYRYDLIFMDLEMPEMDGLEATRLIRSGEERHDLPPVPIVALTAHALMGYREKCLQSGCTGYLSKPVRKGDLLSTVAAAVGSAQVLA